MIYYFSATGNTRFVALQLAEQNISTTDILCFPVHGWRVPGIVRDFLLRKTELPEAEGNKRTLLPQQTQELYIVITCGDDCGKTIDYLKRITDPLGISIKGAFSVQMPESYIGLPFMDVDTKERELQKISNARQRVVEIARIINEGRSGVYDVHEGGCPYIKSKIIGGFFHHVLISDKTFRVDNNLCIGCGKCQKVCPVENISIDRKTNTPQWQHNRRCLTCFACYHTCPNHAISFNGRITKNKGQYNTLMKK